ncbi:MAG: AAA family ATPase, partial [Succinivibrio sp.]|nr:AAA family ATPase [Succinivibrio sp.]
MTNQNELTNSGVEDFALLRQEGDIYIDKTLYLKEIYAQYVKPDGKPTHDMVLLFTRPRRFGKTLTLGMLRNFFELNYQDPTDRSRAEILFRGLAISEDKEFCEKYLGRYPVVSISFKEIDGIHFHDAIGCMLDSISELYESFKLLSTRPEMTAEQLSSYRYYLNFSNHDSDRKWSDPDYLANAVEIIKNSLAKLMSYLKTVYGQNVILLIDEYDVPLQKAKLKGYYEEMLDVIRGMFGKALKTNPNLEKGIVTGCLRITHESIFTGVNNFSV